MVGLSEIPIALVSSVVVAAPGTPTATGQLSVADEDTDDAGGFAATDLALQTRADSGSAWATANTDTANDGKGLKIDGTYGALYIKSDGSWSYELDNDDADTQALDPDDAVLETFELRVTDGTDAPSATKTLTITVQGTNDAPIIGDGTDDGTLAVDVAEGTKAVATLTATDPDGDGLTYALSGADKDLFAVSGTGVVTFINAPDFSSTAAENTKTFTLTVTDDSTDTLTDSVDVVVTITDVNAAPVFVDASDAEISTLAMNVAENTTAVATLKATDADAGASLTYSVTGGADMGLFEITTGTSDLVFKTAPDFEALGSDAGSNTYVVEVTVTDGTDSNVLTITVTVTNANDVTLDFSAAVEASATVTPIVENTDYSSTPTDVAELTATDDSGATVSYKIVTSLTDNTEITGGVFSIFTDANGRKLLRYTGPAINHEATASLMAFVEATSSDGDTIIKAIEVAVTDANDAPILLVNGGVSFNADETSVTLTPTALLVSDEDSSNTITFTLVAAPVAGTLALSGTALAATDTFTMADIVLGKVTYTPPSTPIDTSFTFTYSDGTVTSEIKSFVVTVREKTTVEEGDNTLDLSNITEAQEVITDDGQDKIIDSQGDDYIETGRGDDTVDLSSGGADTIAYNVDGGEDGLVGTDGNTRVTGFTRDEDKILFKTAESAITTLNAFLIDGQGELNDGFADDKFIVTIDYEIAEGPVGGAAYVVLFTGMTFHFRESAVYGGNKLSMPVFEIEFDTPMTTTELFAVSGGRENLDGDHGVALKTLVKLDDNGEVEENYVANILGADSIDFTPESLTLTGDGDDNVLTGGAGDDTLSGLGGDDTLTGGAGDDIFVLNLSGTNTDLDTVVDFSNSTGNDDEIRVDTTNGNETTLAALKTAANIYWEIAHFTDNPKATNDSGVMDTIIYSTAGTADTSDDFALMVLEDYTTALTIADFDII